MNGYIGSVRFFKNLILLLVIVFITVPTVFSFRYKAQVTDLKAQLAQQQAQQAADNEKLNQQIQALEEELKTFHVDPEGPDYQSLYPDFYAPQQLSATTREENVIYLTFDDGPSYRTPEVLEILREENVKATFFVIGKDSETRREWMRAIVDDGHTIAMHSYTHEYTTIYASVEDYLHDMYQIFTMIREATGVTPTHFRMPGGSVNGYNYEVSQEIITEMLRRGFIPYDWNISSGDASTDGATPDEILYNVLRGAGGNRGIVLMHDSIAKYSTVDALRSIIQTLREMGYTFDGLQADTAPILFSYTY